MGTTQRPARLTLRGVPGRRRWRRV